MSKYEGEGVYDANFVTMQSQIDASPWLTQRDKIFPFEFFIKLESHIEAFDWYLKVFDINDVH
jgi:hypothetical protein